VSAASPYVTEELLSMDRETVKDFARQLGHFSLISGNPALNGWAVETNFMVLLRNSKQANETIQLYSGETGGVKQLPVEEVVSFGMKDKIIDVAKYLTNKNNDAVWFVPKEFNFPSIDCFRVIASEKTIQLFQITRASKHSFDVPLVQQLVGNKIKGAKIEKFELVIMYPNGNPNGAPKLPPGFDSKRAERNSERKQIDHEQHGEITFDKMASYMRFDLISNDDPLAKYLTE